MPTINDYKKSSLTNFGYTGSISDAEYKWLRAQVSPYKGAIPDMWNKYLYNRGFTTGPLPHRLARYLQSLGYTGALPNMLYQFWKNGAAPAWAANTDLWWDATDNALINGASPFSITDTHAQTIYEPNEAGVYSPFTANVLTRTDLGLQTVPTRTNLTIYSNDLDNAGGWAITQSGGTALIAQEGTSIFGDSESYKISRNGATFPRNVSVARPLTAATYTSWAIARKGSGVFSIREFQASGVALASFDFDTGIATLTTGTAAGMTRVGNWWVCWVSFTATAANHQQFLIPGIYDGGTGSEQVHVCHSEINLGAFPAAPIKTTTAAATVNGNQQVISGLGTQLATGVAGLVQVDIKQAASDFVRVLDINGGSDVQRISIFSNAGNLSIAMRTASVEQGTVNIGTWATGVQTIAFAAGTNFINGRLVGQALPTADTVATMAAPSKINFGGYGYAIDANTYQYTRKLALKFGPQDASTFAEMYARAVLAAA